MEENLPVVNLELNSGVFRIKTAEAIYQITVQPESSLSRVVDRVVEKETAPQRPLAEEGPPRADLFYQQLSEEMFQEIGRVARELSLSLKDLPGAALEEVDLKKAGVELEEAKGQLEDIVRMTEKATMDIMDTAESILEDCREVEAQLGKIKEAAAPSEGEALPAADPAYGEFLAAMLEKEEQVRALVGQVPPRDEEPAPETAPPAPAAEKIKVYHFDLDVVFQTLYELCTNETVKGHLKAMREDQGAAFEAEGVCQALAGLAPDLETEDEFFNFPLSAILKALFQASRSDKYKQVLKKMNQTAGSIFLDQTLPLEGRVEEQKVAAEPAPGSPEESPAQAPAAGRLQELLGLIEENISLFEAEKERWEKARPAETEAGPPADQASAGEREGLQTAVGSAEETVQRIISRITRILEALSFQDLSGQRILKIVRLITRVQVQLLSLLVSFGTKIKQKKEGQIVSPRETQEMAQDEVDRMLERISTPAPEAEAEAGGRLDQDAVDNLLAEMGF